MKRRGPAIGAPVPVPEPSAEPREDGRQRGRRPLTQAHVVATALLALATGIVALLFQLAPGLKPDPRDRVGADVSIFALEPGVTLDQWITRAFPEKERGEMEDRYPDRAARGEVLYVRTAVDGHKHRDVTLRYAVYDGGTHKRVPDHRIDRPQDDPLAISAPDERSVQILWVPDLAAEPDLFVRVELMDENGMLAVADSPRIVHGRLVP